ncbi:hypothetical protein EON81_03755 [bacterium]|nr:MAG: hypothetical protein EON81_03755 [bacterium]
MKPLVSVARTLAAFLNGAGWPGRFRFHGASERGHLAIFVPAVSVPISVVPSVPISIPVPTTAVSIPAIVVPAVMVIPVTISIPTIVASVGAAVSVSITIPIAVFVLVPVAIVPVVVEAAAVPVARLSEGGAEERRKGE